MSQSVPLTFFLATRMPLSRNTHWVMNVALGSTHWANELSGPQVITCKVHGSKSDVAGWSTICASACKTNTTQKEPNQISNTQRTENKTTDVVIQQHGYKLLMMDILMSETCWAHKKWNKIASDIKLVFHSSTITMMHSPINIRVILNCPFTYFSSTQVLPLTKTLKTF